MAWSQAWALTALAKLALDRAVLGLSLRQLGLLLREGHSRVGERLRADRPPQMHARAGIMPPPASGS